MDLLFISIDFIWASYMMNHAGCHLWIFFPWRKVSCRSPTLSCISIHGLLSLLRSSLGVEFDAYGSQEQSPPCQSESSSEAWKLIQWGVRCDTWRRCKKEALSHHGKQTIELGAGLRITLLKRHFKGCQQIRRKKLLNGKVRKSEQCHCCRIYFNMVMNILNSQRRILCFLVSRLADHHMNAIFSRIFLRAFFRENIFGGKVIHNL